MSGDFHNKHYAIIVLCYNENNVIIELLEELYATLKESKNKFEVIVVDDGSTDHTFKLLKKHQASHTELNINLSLLKLKYNVGHQRAIFQALLYAKEQAFQHVIVMDGDGQDDPQAILALMGNQTDDIVYVKRGKRKEGLLFRFLYWIYLTTFKFITGKSLNFGNYCMISKKVVDTMVDKDFIHFAAHLSRLKYTSTSIQSDRKARLGGSSKMNIDNLIHHAFRSFVEYADQLLILFLKLSVFLAFSFICSILYVLYEKIFTDNAILGWASTLSVSLFACFLICIGFFIIGVMLKNLFSQMVHHKKPIYTIYNKN